MKAQPSKGSRHAEAEARVTEWDAQDRELLSRIAFDERLPSHIAIIMDGNGRWAASRGYRQRIQGHQAGIQAVRETTETAAELGVGALTLYAFSKENWNRPRSEIKALMTLLETFLLKERPRLMKNKIRLLASGETEDLTPKAQKILQETIKMTSENTRMVLNLALSYSGREEITRAARHLARLVSQGKLNPESITSEMFSTCLYHPELGDPDLLIRTSGELRVSNFLLWQIAYSELYITPVLWPDFRRRHLLEAIVSYQHRDRRFGRVR